MRMYELLHERQSNASTFMRAGLRALDAVKALEQLRDFIGWDAHSAVLDGQLSRAIEPGQANGDATLEGVLERVRKKVQDDLCPHLAIYVQRFGKAWAVKRQREARTLHRGAEGIGEVNGKSRKVGRLVVRLHAAPFNACEVQQRVDQFQEPQGVALCGVDALTLSFGERVLALSQRVFQGPEHQGQRGTEFMTDIGEELGFGSVDFRQRFRAPALFLISARVRHRGGHRGYRKIVEGAVEIVERKPGADPSNHDSDRGRATWRGDR